jgi:hypothetical protein
MLFGKMTLGETALGETTLGEKMLGETTFGEPALYLLRDCCHEAQQHCCFPRNFTPWRDLNPAPKACPPLRQASIFVPFLRGKQLSSEFSRKDY